MNERDIVAARKLLATKSEIKWALDYTKIGKESTIDIASNSLVVRTSVLKEMLDKELNYVNRMLKSLGVTEIK